MTSALWNLAAYSIQLAVLVAVAARRDCGCCGCASPRTSLRFWQAVLAIASAAAVGATAQRRSTGRCSIVSRPSSSASRAASRALAARGIDVAQSHRSWRSSPASWRGCSWLGLGFIRLRAHRRPRRPDAVARRDGRANCARSLGVARRRRHHRRDRQARPPLACGARSSCCRAACCRLPPRCSAR